MGNHYQPNSNIPLDGSPVRQAPANSVLSVQHLEKTYGNRGKKGRGATTRALTDVSFDVNEGEFVAIMGASGSGKSTLLNCVSTIDSATSGHVFVRGVDVTSMRAGELARFRREQLGFIFQDSNLLDTLTARENIALPLTISRVSAGETLARVEEMARRLNIADVLDKYPYQLSGGQQQRVACARAMMERPSVIFADEPTGNLDSRSSREVLGFLRQCVQDYGQSIVMVTHDPRAASFADRVLVLSDGSITQDMDHPTYDDILAVFAEHDDPDNGPVDVEPAAREA